MNANLINVRPLKLYRLQSVAPHYWQLPLSILAGSNGLALAASGGITQSHKKKLRPPLVGCTLC
jgi:hypothetical protein